MFHPYSLYLHIPFCRHRCSYCDFNTYAGLGQLVPDYVAALAREIEIVAAAAGTRLPAHTIFLGGGTPSLLPAESIERILRALADAFDFQPGMEITLEANPGTVSADYLKALRGLGVNRLSLGAQSSHSMELALLERQHDYVDVIRAVGWARQAGFDNLSLDLIFGLPGQTSASWGETLSRAVNLNPEHLSLYALTIEPGTPLQSWVGRGLLIAPDDDLAADMYELASEKLAAAGFLQYEISNWAKPAADSHLSATASPAFASRHNLQYWRNRPYLGFGAGAHGYANNMRTANVLHPAEYISRLQPGGDNSLPFPRSPAIGQLTPVDRAAEIAETMMMGLRLTREGVSDRAFTARFGESLRAVFAPQITRLIGLGLLEWAGPDNDVLRLTDRGRLLGNQVFVEFV